MKHLELFVRPKETLQKDEFQKNFCAFLTRQNVLYSPYKERKQKLHINARKKKIKREKALKSKKKKNYRIKR